MLTDLMFCLYYLNAFKKLNTRNKLRSKWVSLNQKLIDFVSVGQICTNLTVRLTLITTLLIDSI